MSTTTIGLHYSDPIKSAILQGRQLPRRSNHAVKLEQALEWMGKRHVLHPSNRVKRLAEPLPDVFSWKPSKVLRRIR